VELVPADFVGTPRREARDFRVAHAAFVPKVNDELIWLRTSAALREPVRQYLSIAVDCATLGRPNRAGSLAGVPGDPWTGSVRARDLPPDVPLLVAYRAAICDALARGTLDRLRTIVPRFIETSYFLARLQVVAAVAMSGSSTSINVNIDIGSGNTRAQTLLAEARERFPESASLTYLSAASNQLAGDCRAALDFYDKTLAVKSLHEDALLGRTTCLSYLERRDEAIAGATRMIDLRTDNWGEAYWRAWNLVPGTTGPPARTSSGRRRSRPATDVHAGRRHRARSGRAGDRRIRPDTREDVGSRGPQLHRDVVSRPREAEAGTLAGLSPPLRGCHDLLRLPRAGRRAGLRTTQVRTDLDPDFKARRITGFEAALKEDRSQYHAAAFNAANQSAHGGNIDKARLLIEIAAKDPPLPTRSRSCGNHQIACRLRPAGRRRAYFGRESDRMSPCPHTRIRDIARQFHRGTVRRQGAEDGRQLRRPRRRHQGMEAPEDGSGTRSRSTTASSFIA
jgi:tetratricopeptide (TPR) repeat protein